MKLEENVYKKHLLGWQLLAATLSIGLIAVFADAVMLHAENEALRNMNELLLEIDYTKYQQLKAVEEEPEETYQEVIFTNYHLNDGSSTIRVGATTDDNKRLSIDDFEVNNRGFYTYNGKVVCAAATTNGLESSYGVLKNYNEEVEGIKYYTYFDEIEIELEGVRYEAIVLDTCKNSHDKEWLDTYASGLNLIDIFIADESREFGKVKGKVYGSN